MSKQRLYPHHRTGQLMTQEQWIKQRLIDFAMCRWIEATLEELDAADSMDNPAWIPAVPTISAADWFDLDKRYEYFRSRGMVGTPATPGMAYQPAIRGSLNVNDPVYRYRTGKAW